MSSFSDLRYQTSELRKSKTISKVEAKQGDFSSGFAVDTRGKTETFKKREQKGSDVKTQYLGALVKSENDGLTLWLFA